jgi:hypothetical protein
VQIAGGTETTLPLLNGAIFAGTTAAIIILAMSLGLIIPKMVVDYFGNRLVQTRFMGAAEHVNAR